MRNLLQVIEDLYCFEFSDPHSNREYVYGVEISSKERIVLDSEEHSEYRWCDFHKAMELLHWKENREALRRLSQLLKQRHEP